jgi:hypothetical protein
MKNVNFEEDSIQDIIPLKKMYNIINEKNPFEECLIQKKNKIISDSSTVQQPDSNDSFSDELDSDDEQYKRDCSPGLKKL